MKTVSAREANQHFSRILAEVKAGNEVVVTSYGQPIAKIIPYSRPSAGPERRDAVKRLIDGFKGYHLGGKAPRRDELYER